MEGSGTRTVKLSTITSVSATAAEAVKSTHVTPCHCAPSTVKSIDGPDTTDYILRPQEIVQGIQKELRPKWGDWDRKMDAEQQSREKNKR